MGMSKLVCVIGYFKNYPVSLQTNQLHRGAFCHFLSGGFTTMSTPESKLAKSQLVCLRLIG